MPNEALRRAPRHSVGEVRAAPREGEGECGLPGARIPRDADPACGDRGGEQQCEEAEHDARARTHDGRSGEAPQRDRRDRQQNARHRPAARRGNVAAGVGLREAEERGDRDPREDASLDEREAAVEARRVVTRRSRGRGRSLHGGEL